MKTVRTLLVAGMVLTLTGMALCQASGPAREPTSRPAGVFGTLVKVDGTNLVVEARQRGAEPKEVTVPTNDKTQFVVDAEPGKLSDLKPEMRVMITPEAGTAEKVVARSRGLSGMIEKVEGKNVVVNVRQRGAEPKETTVTTDEKTKIFINDKPAKLEDLKPRMFVTVLPETGTATKIIAGGPPMGGRMRGPQAED